MIEPPKPSNEAERMAFLQKLRILDTPIEERFERITRIVCRSLNVPISAISLIDDSRQWFKSIQGLNVSETPRKVAFCAHAILENKPFVVADAKQDARFKGNPLVTDDPNIRFYAGCPIDMGDGLRIGTLCAIDRVPREVTEADIETLKDLTGMVRSELQNVALSEAHESLITELSQAERAALIDVLTSLWNRGGGEKLLKREWDVALRKKTPITLALVDIDHFKKINDTHGHEAGDTVIRQFGKTLASALRPYDVACRWGGEEFLVILPGCDRKDAAPAMDRIMKAIHEMACTFESTTIKSTASIGAITALPMEEDCVNTTIRLADQALYKAKSEGRDRYVIADEPPSSAVKASAKRG